MPQEINRGWKRKVVAATGSASQVITLDAAVDGICNVKLNGQSQSESDYKVDRTRVTLTGVTPLENDEIVVDYQYAL